MKSTFQAIKTRKFALFLALVMTSVAFAGCAQPDENPGTGTDPGTDPGNGNGDPDNGAPQRQSSTADYGITSGGTGGVYFPIANGIAAGVDTDENIQFSLEVSDSGGSVANARRLADGSFEWATMQNDITFWAINGQTSNFEGQAIPQLRAVASLYLELVQVVTLADSGITTLQDLEGRRVVVGDAGSGTHVNAQTILDAAGITVDFQYLPLSQAADQLRDGNADAAFWTGGIPTGAIEALAATRNVRILEIPDDVRTAAQGASPFFAEAQLAANTYGGQTEAVNTLAVAAILVVHESVPEDDVYLMTQMLFETQTVQQSHAQAQHITLETALDGLSGIPLHAGARAYYEDQDMTVPS